MYEPSWARLEFPFIRAWRARGEAFELCKSDADGVGDDHLDNVASVHGSFWLFLAILGVPKMALRVPESKF